MFGIMFKNQNGRQEMAIRRVFSSKLSAEAMLRTLVANFGPALASRYSVVELTVV